jgi:hypothetical protein
MFRLSVNDVYLRLRDKWRRMRHRHNWPAGLAACPPDETRRIAQDAAAHPGPSELTPLRLRLLGVDPGYVKSALTATYRDLERTCAMCPAWRRCERDLARGAVQAGMVSYCLCAPAMDALAVDPASLPPGITSEPRLHGRRSLPWPMYHRVERRAVRMHEMMQRLDVDPARLARLRRGDAYAEAHARCLSCRASETCLRWLDGREEGDRRPQFCPNLALFEDCKRERVES